MLAEMAPIMEKLILFYLVVENLYNIYRRLRKCLRVTISLWRIRNRWRIPRSICHTASLTVLREGWILLVSVLFI